MLDVCCGTGIGGNEFKKVGFEAIYGMDASAGMMALIDRDVYKQTWQLVIGCDEYPQETLNRFDLVSILGSIVPKHLPYNCFELLLPLIKKGGMVAFAARDLFWNDDSEDVFYKREMNKLVGEGKYVLLKKEGYSRGTDTVVQEAKESYFKT